MAARITRRGLLLSALAGLGGLGAGYGWGLEPRWLEIRTARVRLPRSLGVPVRILHLSDLHWSWFVPLSFIEQALDLGLAQGPDLVCLTGDFVTVGEERDLERYGRALGRKLSGVPAFACLGNHDGGAWSRVRGGYTTVAPVARMLEAAGITVLDSRSAVLETKGCRLVLVGTGDLWAGGPAPGEAFARVEPGGGQAATILLAHNPDTKQAVDHLPWDLLLCGHTHGGQVVIPGLGPPLVPVKDRRFVAGLNAWRGRLVYTTRGVGSIYGLRVHCRPEVTLLDLV